MANLHLTESLPNYNNQPWVCSNIYGYIDIQIYPNNVDNLINFDLVVE